MDDAQITALAEQVADLASTIGLHAQHHVSAQSPSGSRLLIIDFLIGDLAWSDRVQKPERDADETTLRALELQQARDELEELKGRIERGEQGLPGL